MSLFFISNPESPYYQSQAFGKVIAYMMKYTRRCDLREQNTRRSMLVKDVKNVETAVGVLQEIVAMQVEEDSFLIAIVQIVSQSQIKECNIVLNQLWSIPSS